MSAPELLELLPEPDVREAFPRINRPIYLIHIRIADVAAGRHAHVRSDVGPFERPGAESLDIAQAIFLVHVPKSDLDPHPLAMLDQREQPVWCQRILHVDLLIDVVPGCQPPIGQVERKHLAFESPLGSQIYQLVQLMLVVLLDHRPHLGPKDAFAPTIVVEQFAILDHFLKVRSAPDPLKGFLVGPVNRNLDFVRVSVNQLLVVVFQVQQGRIGGDSDPDMLRAGIPDHPEKLIALHGRFPKALQLDLKQTVLLVYQPLEGVHRHVLGAFHLGPIAHHTHGASKIAPADIFDVQLDRQKLDGRGAGCAEMPFVVLPRLRRSRQREFTLAQVRIHSRRWLRRGQVPQLHTLGNWFHAHTPP